MRKYVFYIVIGLFVLHYILQYGFNIRNEFLDSYLDPFLGVIAMISYLHSFVIDDIYVIDIFLIGGIYAIISETIFPLLSPYSVYDSYDYFSILVGASFYALIFKYL